MLVTFANHNEIRKPKKTESSTEAHQMTLPFNQAGYVYLSDPKLFRMLLIGRADLLRCQTWLTVQAERDVKSPSIPP